MTDYRLLWGDIHNHNELGYAQGSLARSYEIARSHLDFYAFTPHGIHADGGVLEGYPVVREGWDEIAAAARVHNEPDVFTTFLAYEWHSNQWGHVHIVHREDVGEMVSAPTLEALQRAWKIRFVTTHPDRGGSAADAWNRGPRPQVVLLIGAGESTVALCKAAHDSVRRCAACDHSVRRWGRTRDPVVSAKVSSCTIEPRRPRAVGPRIAKFP